MRVDNFGDDSTRASKQAVWLACEWNSGKKPETFNMYTMFFVFCQMFAATFSSLFATD